MLTLTDSIIVERHGPSFWKIIFLWLFPTISHSVPVLDGILVQRMKIVFGKIIVYDATLLTVDRKSKEYKKFENALLKEMNIHVAPGGNS